MVVSSGGVAAPLFFSFLRANIISSVEIWRWEASLRPRHQFFIIIAKPVRQPFKMLELNINWNIRVENVGFREIFSRKRERWNAKHSVLHAHGHSNGTTHCSVRIYVYIYISINIYLLDNIKYMYLFTSGDKHVNNYTETWSPIFWQSYTQIQLTP